MRPVPPRGSSLEKGLLGPIFFEGFKALREDTLLRVVLRLTAKRGQSLYLVGGMVRDICLKRPLSNDYDFVYTGHTGELAKEIANALGGSAFVLDRDNGLYRVAIKVGRGGKAVPVTMDFLPLNYPSIEADLSVRDFTINAMAIPLTTLFQESGGVLSLIDPLGGLGDCKKMVLRLVAGEETLRADPLRCLRAVRLAQRYGLSIEDETQRLIKECAPLIREKGVARERVGDELRHIFAAKHTAEALHGLHEFGLLNMVMPALGLAMPEGSLLPLKTLAEAERLLTEITTGEFPNHTLEMKRVFEEGDRGPSPAVALKFAAFFLDCDVNFPKARDLSTVALRELALGNKTIRAVKGLLANLRRWSEAPVFAYDSEVFADLLFRLAVEETGLTPPLFIVLTLADVRGRGKAPRGTRLKALYAMLDYYFDTFASSPPAPLLSGVEIMRDFNIPAGEGVGLLKKNLKKAMLRGEVRDKKEALRHIKKWIDER